MEPHDLPRTDTALYDYHFGAPTPGASTSRRSRRSARGWTRVWRGSAPRRSSSWRRSRPSTRAATEQRQRLVPTYGEALVEQAEREPRLVALDADLRLDCGLVEFRERFPERFFECGIAEQDMVSQAGAMALAGLLPAVPLVRLLPLHAPERADLQQRDRGDEGDLRRARSPASCPAGPATRTSPCATSPRSARCRAWR